MRVISLSMIALMASVGLAAAQAPMQAPGGADLRTGEGRRQQDGGAERLERREQRQEERAQRQDIQANSGERGGPRQENRAERRFEREERRGATDRVEQDRDNRLERRSGNRYDERVIVRDRGPTVRYDTGPDVYIRTLPVQYRTIVVSGRPCRISITRRVRANGRIVTTETRKCPGRPAVVIRTRR